MKTTLLTIITALILGGCASNDPTLADDVYREGDGIYKAMDIKDAIKQCEKENKTIEVITTTEKRSSFNGRNYTYQIFKCVSKGN